MCQPKHCGCLYNDRLQHHQETVQFQHTKQQFDHIYSLDCIILTPVTWLFISVQHLWCVLLLKKTANIVVQKLYYFSSVHTTALLLCQKKTFQSFRMNCFFSILGSFWKLLHFKCNKATKGIFTLMKQMFGLSGTFKYRYEEFFCV